jgi:hypothetical protein
MSAVAFVPDQDSSPSRLRVVAARETASEITR